MMELKPAVALTQQSTVNTMKSQIRITAIRKPFDPEAFAAVLVAAALARLAEETKPESKPRPTGSKRKERDG